MATFDYATYMAQQQARGASSNTAGNNGSNEQRIDVHFLNEYLKNDGDSVLVRFPYTDMADMMYCSTHIVPFPGRKFGARVHCGEAECPFCPQGIKKDIRVFIKALVYIPNADGTVNIMNAVWDRPAAFADIELKNYVVDYGDISQLLFKIRRTGSGQGTRYSLNPMLNASIYNPEVYIADFSELNKIDPSKILAKSLTQYNEAVNKGNAPDQTAPVTAANASAAAPSYVASAANPVSTAVPAPAVSTPAYVAPSVATTMAPNYSAPTPTPTGAPINTPNREPKKYVF